MLQYSDFIVKLSNLFFNERAILYGITIAVLIKDS